VRRQGARQRDTLALPAGQLRGKARLQPVQSNQAEQLVDARPYLLPWRALRLQSERHVVRDRHVPKERVVLEDEPHASFARVLAVDHLVAEHDRALVGQLQSGNDAKNGALAPARGTEQRHQLTRRHLERDVVEGGVGAEALGDVRDRDVHASPLRCLKRSMTSSSSMLATPRTSAMP
jgi:hypothetical protein